MAMRNWIDEPARIVRLEALGMTTALEQLGRRARPSIRRAGEAVQQDSSLLSLSPRRCSRSIGTFTTTDAGGR